MKQIKKVVLSLFIIILFISCGKVEKLPFERDKWIQNPEIRIRMVEDLLGNSELLGKSREEIIVYLGQPSVITSVNRIQEVRGSGDVYELNDDQSIAYRLTEEYITAEDNRALLILFDNNDRAYKFVVGGFIT